VVLEKNVKNKWTDIIKNDEASQRAKEERLLSKILKIRPLLWRGHTVCSKHS